MGKIFDKLAPLGKVAKKHPNYTATAATIVGVAILAIFAFAPAFLPVGGLTSTPMGYIMPIAVLGGGIGLGVANYLARNTKYAPLVRKISAIAVPILMAGAGGALLTTGFGDFYSLAGLALLVGSVGIAFKYSLPLWRNSGVSSSKIRKPRKTGNATSVTKRPPDGPGRGRRSKSRSKTRKKRRKKHRKSLTKKRRSWLSDSGSDSSQPRLFVSQPGAGVLSDEEELDNLAYAHKEEISSSAVPPRPSDAVIEQMRRNHRMIPEEWDD